MARYARGEQYLKALLAVIHERYLSKRVFPAAAAAIAALKADHFRIVLVTGGARI